MTSDTQQTATQRWLWRLARIEGHEAGAAVAGFAYIFCAFTAYMILRPVRETMGITSGVSNLPSLFWGTLAVTLLGFYVWFHFETDHTWIARAFFIWITVFALFVPSVFWSLMADIFKPEQAKRLYGFLAAGTSAGGVLGPFIAAMLAPVIGTINLLLFSMVFLAASIFCIRYLTMWHERAVAAHQAAAEVRGDVNQPLGGSLWAGFTLVAKSPYLLSIAAFILLL